MLNKAAAAANQTVSLSGVPENLTATHRTIFRGASEADIYPTLGDMGGQISAHGGALTLELPPLSVTVVAFESQGQVDTKSLP